VKAAACDGCKPKTRFSVKTRVFSPGTLEAPVKAAACDGCSGSLSLTLTLTLILTLTLNRPKNNSGELTDKYPYYFGQWLIQQLVLPYKP